MEENIGYVLEEINKFVLEENQQTVRQIVQKAIEKAQDDGFMKGYKYALEILQESMIKKEQLI